MGALIILIYFSIGAILIGPSAMGLENRNKCAPLDFTFSVYKHGSLTLGKTIWDKTQVLFGTSCGTNWEPFENLMGTHWEQEGKKIPLSPCPLKKKKKLDHS
jgi:hypothetical protein